MGEIAAALSMEGFRASVWPIAADVAGAHPAPGQEWQAAGLRELLQGGALLEPGAARRLQDPLSFRCASHVHGALRSALDLLAAAVIAELNGAGDNPLVLPGGEIVSTGNFHTPALALALDATAIALAQTAAQAAERPARLATERLSGLPANLSPGGGGRSGVAPLLKSAQALAVEIRHLAAPFAIDPQLRSRRRRGRLHERRRRGDAAGRAATAARPPDRARARVRRPGGRPGRAGRLGQGTAAAHACVRQLVAPLGDDRAARRRRRARWRGTGGDGRPAQASAGGRAVAALELTYLSGAGHRPARARAPTTS